MFAKAQVSAQSITEQQHSSPSPTTILKTVNNSGHYMCAQRSTNVETPSPTVIYHEASASSISNQQNMMKHRNNVDKISIQLESSNQFEFDEADDNITQHNQPQHYLQYNNFDYSQNQMPSLSVTQQQADQQSIELRMNNLGNEDSG